MATKRHKPEEIVSKLRQVEVLVGQGMSRIDAIRQVRITDIDLLPVAKAIWWDGSRPTERTQTPSESERAAAQGSV